MEEITEGKIALRKATADEIEFLKARGDKQGKESFKKTIPIAVIGVLVPFVFYYLNETRYHKPLYTILACVLFVFELIAFSILLYSRRKGYTKQVIKGEFKVQRGRIVEIRKKDSGSGQVYDKAVFESDDGITSIVDLENDYFNEVTKGPCILIKWDSYGELEVYEAAMLDQSLI